MKKFTLKHVLNLFVLSLLVTQHNVVMAQCNVNEKYDKIVSGYHSSIAMKDDGSFAAWGQAFAANGTSNLLVPQSVIAANYSGLTGTPLKTTIGGTGSGGKDQAIMLTTTGLFAWGYKGGVLATSLTGNATAFVKITTPTGGDATTKLPSGVAPEDVASLFATYQTLAIVTTTGNVWMLTQNSTLQGNGAAAATTTWHKVKTDASTYLSGVIAIRGQASSSSYAAMMALTSTGDVYTWGVTTYLGNGTAAASRTYATWMTLPAEFNASNKPTMIGVTGGIKVITNTKNTYYVLSASGALYAMGFNGSKQCGDFTTTERTSWVRVKKSAAANDNFTNINFISVQEHNGSFPGVAAITTTSDLYTWGENGGLMLGRAVADDPYDPGFPGGFTTGTDKAVSAELGGHTLVYIREGSSQFCYVGHKVSGSMGDNDATDTNISSFNCSGTPVLSICGYVPVVASGGNSTIAAADNTITANGVSTTTITIRLKDALGNNLTTSGGVVIVTTTNGVLGTVTDNNDGTYTVVLTSASSVGSTTIGFSVNGTTSPNTTQVNFAAGLPLTWLYVNALRAGQQVKVEWSTTQEVNVSYFEIERSLNGTNWTVLPGKIPALNTAGTHNYSVNDKEYIQQQVLYRVRQIDIDGKYSYSSIKTVYADKGATKIAVYPVPASVRFYLNNVNARDIKAILMINESGMVVKRWNEYLPFFDISELKKGVYFLKVELKDGNFEQLRMSKY